MGSALGAGVFGDADEERVSGVTGDGERAMRMLDETPRSTTGVVCNGRRGGLFSLLDWAAEPLEVVMIGTALRGGGGRLCSDAERT